MPIPLPGDASPTVPMNVSPGLDEGASSAGLRTVAIFESLKGVLVIVLAVALLCVRNRIEDYAEDLLYHLHIDFDHRFAHAVLNAASKLSDARVWAVLLGAVLYSSVRFVEAWGLWHRRIWAEWFALLSGGLYLPWELMRIAEKPTWDRIAVLAINLVIILYMLEIRIRAMRAQKKAYAAASAASSRR
jgi:uncharacterized membrane protein (DUF2068 family)